MGSCSSYQPTLPTNYEHSHILILNDPLFLNPFPTPLFLSFLFKVRSLSEVEGKTKNYTIELFRAPSSPVTLTINIVPGPNGGDGKDVSVIPMTKVFAAGSTEAAAKLSLTVSFVDDKIEEEDVEPLTLQHVFQSVDSGYNFDTLLDVSVVDNDAAAVWLVVKGVNDGSKRLVSSASFITTEDTSEEFGIQLGSQPTASVFLDVASVVIFPPPLQLVHAPRLVPQVGTKPIIDTHNQPMKRRTSI